jgi:DNA-binding LacI/PurR family transcriptional regulator
VHDAHVFEYPFEGEWNDFRSGREIGLHIAAQADRPDALFVFNDLGALGLIDGLTERGVRVPEDLAVVGYDGIAMGAQSPVPLTTVRQPVERIGQQAVNAVLAQLAGEKWAFPDVLPPELVVRVSSGAPPRLRTSEVMLQNEPTRPVRSLAEHGQVTGA